jgi:hypothetical protein
LLEVTLRVLRIVLDLFVAELHDTVQVFKCLLLRLLSLAQLLNHIGFYAFKLFNLCVDILDRQKLAFLGDLVLFVDLLFLLLSVLLPIGACLQLLL